MRYVDVLLPLPLPDLYTYALPPAWEGNIQVGCRVLVPFGQKHTHIGLIMRIHLNPPADPAIQVREILDLLDRKPIILPQQTALWQWMADYYLCTQGEVFKAAIAPLPTKKGRRMQPPPPPPLMTTVSPLPTLSDAQQNALNGIRDQWQKKSVCLLHGVTASGKTEIYIHLIAEAVEQRRQVLYLLPEIVLTSQLTDRLRAVFGTRLGVYHSKFSDRQRSDVWLRQLSSQPYDIIVGVRSSIFLPFSRLGLVIVDEEHEVNFKQQEPAPRYNARNVAILMATQAHAHTLLGTATPSFESYYNARKGKYGLVTLSERYSNVQMPDIEIIDVSELRRKRLMPGPFSPQLIEAMTAALDSHEQIILFQNRRGFAPQVQCHVCGWVPRCPHCDVPLAMHKATQRMTCHYCGFTTDIPQRCPACENPDLRGHGFGTERIEDQLRRLFPEARLARMDLDTTRTREAYEQIIADFAQGNTDILVGTQMVTKGLDFERVSVVGILSADTMLNQPDFRAYERSFQMMTQVAGRAGRRERRGRVLLQTTSATLPLIRQVVDNDFESMYREQMTERRDFAYPPFVRLITTYVKHRNRDTAEAISREATAILRRHFGSRVLGPDEPPVARIQSLYIRRIIVKLESTLPLAKARQLLTETRRTLLAQAGYSSAHIYFDVDPL